METIVIRVQKNFLIKFSYTKEFIKIRKGLEMEYLLRTGCRYPELIKKKKGTNNVKKNETKKNN